MDFINTNLIHNVLNVVLVVAGVIAGFSVETLAAIGITATVAGKITAAAAALKLVINAVRDGLAGMIKTQPPVV